LRAACVSDGVSAAILLCISSGLALHEGLPHDLGETEFWHWLGGPCTACFTCIITIVPKYIGMSSYSCSFIVGEQLFGLLVDAAGLFLVTRPASPRRIAGIAIAALGAILHNESTRDRKTKFIDVELTPPASA